MTPLPRHVLIALAVISAPLFAASAASAETLDPNAITQHVSKPDLALTDQQRTEIQDALVTVNNAQKAPPNFEAKIGAKVPTGIKITPVPSPLILQQPVLKQYSYAKLPDRLLIIDPLKATIVAVIDRKFPSTTGKGGAAQGETSDPASKGDQAEKNKMN
ncbi:MAG: DUF1236 domain-containing protein [Pseudolabrys sp.]